MRDVDGDRVLCSNLLIYGAWMWPLCLEAIGPLIEARKIAAISRGDDFPIVGNPYLRGDFLLAYSGLS
jgi:hypothetical protein